MDKESEEILRRVELAAAEIMELSDSLRIFITRHNSETGQTQHVTFGAGNYYAQEGQVREWIIKATERIKCEVRDEADN